MRLLLLVLALAVSVAAAGCGGDGDGEPQTLRIGYAWGADVGDTGDRLAFEALTRNEGIDVRFRDMGGVPQSIVGLTRGDIDLAQVSYMNAVEAVGAGAKIRAVMGSNMAPEFLLVSRPGIEQPADLRGKRVAHSGPGTGDEALLLHGLRKGGLTPSDVKVSVIDDSVTRAAALAAGRIDATPLEVPDYELLRAKDRRYRILARMTEIWPPVPHSLWIVNKDWADEHPDQLERVVSGLLDGYASVYTEDGKRAWVNEARRNSLQGDNAAIAPSLYGYYKSVRYWPTQDRIVDESGHDRAIRVWLDTGQIEKGVPYRGVWYDTSAEGGAG